jgi:hypothetical protein
MLMTHSEPFWFVLMLSRYLYTSTNCYPSFTGHYPNLASLATQLLPKLHVQTSGLLVVPPKIPTTQQILAQARHTQGPIVLDYLFHPGISRSGVVRRSFLLVLLQGERRQWLRLRVLVLGVVEDPELLLRRQAGRRKGQMLVRLRLHRVRV